MSKFFFWKKREGGILISLCCDGTLAACRLSHPQTTTTTTGQECRIPMTTINEIMHDGAQGSSSGIEIKFSHVQLYVDHVCPVDEYKQFEAEVNKKFLESSVVLKDDTGDLLSGGGDSISRYSQCSSNKDETAFPSHGRDVVKVRQATSIFVFSTKGIPTLFDVINPNSTPPNNSNLLQGLGFASRDAIQMSMPPLQPPQGQYW